MLGKNSWQASGADTSEKIVCQHSDSVDVGGQAAEVASEKLVHGRGLHGDPNGGCCGYHIRTACRKTW